MKKINFNMLLNEIKSLNPKEIHNWPLWTNFAVGFLSFVLALILGVFFIISDQYSDYQNAVSKEEVLKKEYIEKKKQAINIDLYKQQLNEIIQVSDELLKQLPNRSEVEKLLIYINQAGISRGLRFDLFKPGNEKLSDFYAELPISIKVVGNFNSLGNFCADISQLSRVVLLKDMSITVNKDKELVMEATAKTFRYLDQAELDQQKEDKRKALIEKNKKNKKE